MKAYTPHALRREVSREDSPSSVEDCGGNAAGCVESLTEISEALLRLMGGEFEGVVPHVQLVPLIVLLPRA